MRPKKRHIPFSMISNGVWLLTLLAILFVSTSPAIADVSGTDEYPPFIPDGKWMGAFSGSDLISVSGAIASATYKGKLSFEVIAQEVAGDFTATGTSDAEGSDAYGSATFTSTGLVQGGAESPEIFPTNTTMNFEIYLKGSSTPIKFSSSGAGEGSLAMTITSGFNCNQVSGNFDVSTVAFLNQYNAQTLQLSTQFNAVRVGGIYKNDPDAYQQKMSELMNATADLLLDTMKNQSMNGKKLFDLIEQSINISSGIALDTSCNPGSGIDHKWFQSMIAGYIGKLIDLAYDHPDWFAEYQIRALTYAALEVGLTGSGAVDQAKADGYESKLQKIALDKLKALEQQKADCDALYALALMGQMLPGSAVYDQAHDLMVKNTCTGLL